MYLVFNFHTLLERRLLAKFQNSVINSYAQFIYAKSKGACFSGLSPYDNNQTLFPDCAKTRRKQAYHTGATDFSCAVSGFFAYLTQNIRPQARARTTRCEHWSWKWKYLRSVLKSRNTRKLLAKISYASSKVYCLLSIRRLI